MFILKEEVALKSSLRSRSRGAFCNHTGTGRRTLKISIFRHEAGRRVRLAALPGFRNCCRNNTEARAAWWRGTLAVLDRIYGPKPTPRALGDRRRVEGQIRKLIPLPIGLRPMKKDLKAALKTAREMEVAVEQAIAARQQTTSPCWSMLGIFPGAPYHEIKRGLNETLARLNRESACVGEFRVAHNMAQECIQRLNTGEW